MSKLHRSVLPLLALIFVTAPGIAGAQSASKEAAKRDVAVWGEALQASFPPGYWEGEFQDIDAKGKVVKSTNQPDCIEPGEFGPTGKELQDAFLMVIDLADCTTTSGGVGSLNLLLDCRAPTGGTMRFDSRGTSGNGQVDWTVAISSTGPGAFENRTMKVAMRRVRETC